MTAKGSHSQSKALFFEFAACFWVLLNILPRSSHVVSPTPQNRHLTILLSLWMEVVAASCVDEGPYVGRQAFAFFDVLCPKRQFLTHGKWTSSRQDLARFLSSKLEEHVLPQSSEVSTLAERISFRGPRRFVILSRGYYGIAPPITQKGDVYAFIYGTESLSILRPAEGKPGGYKVVGPVHVESKTMLNPSPWL
jgi:hypothetical protein